MHHFFRAASVWLTVLLACAVVRAEEPALTPPMALGTTDVPYPAGASGDSSVVLELTVEKD